MDNEILIKYYKDNHEKKIFHSKLVDDKPAHIMYIYDYDKELKNFSTTFLMYLPYYVRSFDQLSTIKIENIDLELEERSKKVRVDKIVPQRKTEVNGLYGELFLDFFLRIVCKRKCLITYAKKRSFSSDAEAHGPDNVVYFIENGNINICFCEAKFVSGASSAKNNLIEDINGTPSIGGRNGKPSHISKAFLNNYIGFMVSQSFDVMECEKSLFLNFINDLNSKIDISNDFISSLIDFDVCCNFIFFAIFDSTKKTPQKLINHYNDIYQEAEQKIKELNITNYKIEIVFIPTNSKPIEIKKEIDKNYE